MDRYVMTKISTDEGNVALSLMTSAWLGGGGGVAWTHYNYTTVVANYIPEITRFLSFTITCLAFTRHKRIYFPMSEPRDLYT